MISGAHVVLYSKDAEADRDFFRDVLGLKHVDVGDGWLIFALPPTEVAVHPTDNGASHELYLTCKDLDATIERLRSAGVSCAKPEDQGWGILTSIQLPGGSKLGLYKPKHALAHYSADAGGP